MELKYSERMKGKRMDTAAEMTQAMAELNISLTVALSNSYNLFLF